MEALIQQQLSTDAVAFAQLPFILESLGKSHFSSSGSYSKWVARLNSLARAKDPLARWTGLCLILKTCQISVHLLLENAATWFALALPLLVRSEPVPVHKVSIALLTHIISSATHLPEFQRQVSIPNVPKFATVLIALVSKGTEVSLQCTILDALKKIVDLYPSTVRHLQTQLYKASSQKLYGGYPNPTPELIVERACGLHSLLHKTAGKAGGPTAWRKLLDATLAASAACLAILAGSNEREFSIAHPTLELPPIPIDPLVAVPSAFNRLKCMTGLMGSLLRVPLTRIVHIPVQNIVDHALNCMRLPVHGPPDVPPIALGFAALNLGCQILASLALSVSHSLRPHMSRILAQLTYHLSQVETPVNARISLLRASLHVLNNVHHPFHDEGVTTRLLKAAIIPLSKLSPISEHAVGHPGAVEGSAVRGKGKGKKRARGYEGEELLRSASSSALLNASECQEILLLLEVAQRILQSGFVSDALQSLLCRMLLSLAFYIPLKAPAALSDNLSFHSVLRSEIAIICTALSVDGSGGHTCSSLGLFTSIASPNSAHSLERMIHPKMPPALGTAPQIENLLLHHSKEPDQEKYIRVALGFETSTEAELRLAPDLHSGTGNTNVMLEMNRGVLPIIPVTEVVDPPVEPSGDTLMRDEGSASQKILKPVASPMSSPQSAPSLASRSGPTLQDSSASISSVQYCPPEWASSRKEVLEPGTPELTGDPLDAKTSRMEGSDEDEIPTIDMRSDSEDEM